MENKKKRHSIITIILIIFIMLAGFGAYWYFTNLYVSKECKEIRKIATNMYNLEDNGISGYSTKTIIRQVEDAEEYTGVTIEDVDAANKSIKWITQDRYEGYVEDNTSYMTIENGQECRYERYWSNDDQTYYWYKQVYENMYEGVEPSIMQFSHIIAIEMLPMCDKAELVLEEEDGTKVYSVVIDKSNIKEVYNEDEIFDDAVFEVKIKDGYITEISSDISKWYKEDDITEYEVKITIYNINSTSVSVPSEILNNLTEKPEGY